MGTLKPIPYLIIVSIILSLILTTFLILKPKETELSKCITKEIKLNNWVEESDSYLDSTDGLMNIIPLTYIQNSSKTRLIHTTKPIIITVSSFDYVYLEFNSISIDLTDDEEVIILNALKERQDSLDRVVEAKEKIKDKINRDKLLKLCE